MNETKDTQAWMFQAWATFGLAFLISIGGIVLMPTQFWVRAFVGIAYLFSVAQAFTLAKTVRDNHEAKKMTFRIQEAKAERILRDFDKQDVS